MHPVTIISATSWSGRDGEAARAERASRGEYFNMTAVSDCRRIQSSTTNLAAQ